MTQNDFERGSLKVRHEITSKHLAVKHLVVVVGLGFFVIPLLISIFTPVQEVQAVPHFARKYDVGCTTCHVLPPKLNTFGEAFLARGYRMPEGWKGRNPTSSDSTTDSKPAELEVAASHQNTDSKLVRFGKAIPDWVSVWNSGRYENSNSRFSKGYVNRVEVISAGHIGKSPFSYFVEWRPVSLETRGDGSYQLSTINYPLNHFLSVVAVFDDRATVASSVARAAECATVADQVNVEGEVFSFRHKLIHDLVCACVGAFLRDQSDATQHAEDVCVEREDGFATGKEECAGNRLRTDAAKPFEIRDGILGAHLVKEGKIKHRVLVFDLAEQACDDGSFLIRESAGADRVGDGRLPRTQHSVPRGKAFFQRTESTLAVHIARRLREDDGDEHVERIGGEAVFGDAVSAF